MADLLARAAALFDVDLNPKKAKKSISGGEYAFGRILFKAKSYIEMDELHKAAMVLVELVPYLMEHVSKFGADKLADPETARDILESTKMAVELSQVCDRFKKGVKAGIKEELRDTGLFTEKELDKDVEVFAGVQVDDLFDDNYVRVYRLKDGTAPLPRDMKFKMVKEVAVSRDLDGYVRAAHYMSAKEPGVLIFIPFFKVEERVDLSFWTFFIVYEDYVWIATDQKEFNNPHNKESTRRTDRVRDKKLENMWLPDVFTMLHKKRSESREIAAFGGIRKLLSIPVMKFHPSERFFLIKLAERIVRKCLREELVQATTMGLHTEQLLLEHKGAVPDRSDDLEGWTKDAQAHHAELMATVPAETTKALVPMDYSIVVRSKTFDRNWLGPISQLESLAHWTIVDERRAELQKHFESLKKRRESDGKKFQEVLDARAGAILDFVFSATVIGWITTAVDDFGENKLKSGDKFISCFIEPYNKKDYTYGWSWGHNLTVGLGTGKKDLFSRDAGNRAKCWSCDFHVKKPVKTIHIRHWHQFQHLVGGDREMIPPYFRCYKAHNFVPYTGNSILDNSNPLTLLRDHCTQEDPNGISIQIFLCGFCANKRMKGKPENLVWDGSKLVDPKELKGIKKAEYHGWVMWRH